MKAVTAAVAEAAKSLETWVCASGWLCTVSKGMVCALGWDLAHLSNSTNVLFTVFLAESEVLVEACGESQSSIFSPLQVSTIPNRMLSPV